MDHQPDLQHSDGATTIVVTVRYFAILREAMGLSRASLDVPAGTTVGQVFSLATADQPRLAGLERSLMVMVNEEYVARDHVLAAGDDVAFIPPVSGGSQPLFTITERVIDPRDVEALVARDDAGAIVTFNGTVRNTARGKDVRALEYESYASAAVRMLARIGDEIQATWPEVRCAIHHRTGTLSPGETSVVIACSSPHRAEAFAAASMAIERIKQIVPIWKKEFYADGSTWIGSEAEYQELVRQET